MLGFVYNSLMWLCALFVFVCCLRELEHSTATALRSLSLTLWVVVSFVSGFMLMEPFLAWASAVRIPAWADLMVVVMSGVCYARVNGSFPASS